MAGGAAAAGAGLVSGLSLFSARSASSSAQSRIDAMAAAQARSEQSAADRAGQDILFRKRETAKTIGTLRAAGFTGPVLTQATADGVMDVNTIQANYGQFITASRAGTQAQMDQVASSVPNPFLAAIQGGVQGATLGLSLYTGINDALNTGDEADLIAMRETAAREGGMPYI